MPELPGGTVTFLFTDIEGSTRLWEEHPNAMAIALAQHDLLLRQAIEDNAGYVFKTVGDAFCAAFSTAPAALAAALQSHLSLEKQEWEQTGPLRIRIALHTGQVQERDGDYFGQTLNRVARLQAIGYGLQTLISQSTYTLVRDSLPRSVSLLDLGLHRLKDLQRSEQVFQLLHPDLPAEFPPLKSLDNPDLPNNLPLQVTSFIGREKEIKTARLLLGKTHLLTLTGSGGCGKTRLALQVAAEVLEYYPEGVWVVELASLADPALVPQAVAQAMHLSEEPGKPLLLTLAEALKPRRLLLVLDNCEHLLDACVQLVDTLIHACPHLRVLASSREGLGIAGETVYRIPSLSLPDRTQTATAVSLNAYEAVLLFMDRAAAALPAFVVTDAIAPAVASVCHRLDGIPFAIELAAARVRSLSVEEINSKLDNRFRLLTGGSRTALPRQQTLRALIDWSYDLLKDQEKVLLCRLAVFAGGWTLEAAEAVCTGEGVEEWEIFDLLTSLADKSLVVVEPGEEHTRYRLLETVRQYARDRLVEGGAGEVARGRHQAFFLALAEEAEPQVRGPEQTVWLHRLECEHDNLRAALGWDNAAMPLRIAGALWEFWMVRGYLREGREWLTSVLAGEEARTHAEARTKALHGAGALAHAQGDYTTSRAMHEECLAIRRVLGHTVGIASSLNSLGLIAYAQGDYESAGTLYAESLALCRELGHERGIAHALGNLGNVAREQGDLAMAQALNAESLALRRASGDKQGIATSLNNLGSIASEQGDHGAAQKLYEESLVIYRELGHKGSIAALLGNLGIVTREQGDYTSAHSWNGQSLALLRELGNRRGIANLLESFAGLASAQKKEGRVVQLLGAAEVLREALGAPLPPSVRIHFERQMAQARAALSQEAFAAAWSEGRNRTLDQSIEYALKDEAA